MKPIKILEMMIYIRMVEERIAKHYPQGEMRCPVHLSIGQECVPGVLSTLLDNSDFVVSTHRSHAHYLAKGGNLNALIAELYGKETGCSKGRGGSMHLIDDAVGFKGSTAIVGNTIPIGVGLALAKKVKGESGIVVVYLGDGATEEGVYYESINFAVLNKLPVLFVCENNNYSVYTHIKDRQPAGRTISSVAKALGLHAINTDGYDVIQTYNDSKQVIDNIKQCNGPALIEFSTHRWLEHCGPNVDNELGYRSLDEYSQWIENDPLKKLESKLIDSGDLSRQVLALFTEKINKLIDSAFKNAMEDSYPVSSLDENLVFKL